MKKIPTLFIATIMFTVSACSFAVNTNPVLPTPATIEESTVAPSATVQVSTHKTYNNDQFGLSFQFLAGWFGPEEYIAEQILRVEVGSDKVYPYGTGLEERIYDLKNSYSVVVQYSKNDQNSYAMDVYQSMQNLQDGESLSDARGLMIRVGQVSVGPFHGFEFISTLSESAQTEPVYMRQVILLDDQSNSLSIMGSPNNVEVAEGANWRDVYRMVDEANASTFHEIVESIMVE
jgi:hypothetical protein